MEKIKINQNETTSVPYVDENKVWAEKKTILEPHFVNVSPETISAVNRAGAKEVHHDGMESIIERINADSR